MLSKKVVNTKNFFKTILKEGFFYETNTEIHVNKSDDVLL